MMPFSKKTIVASLAIIVGVILLILKSCIIEYIASSLMLLKPNSPITNIWLDPTITEKAKLYFFNWTNSDDWLKPGTKPRLSLLGPYSYILHNKKKNVVWNDNNTVTYNTQRTFYFDKEDTKGNLSDEVTTINFMQAGVGVSIRDSNYLFKSIVSTVFEASSDGLPFKLTVDEFLAKGFEDPILDAGRMFPFVLSKIPRFERFGLIHMRNASAEYEGTLNMGNGFNGDFNVYNWNYNNITDFNGACANVHGSNGEVYSRTVESKDFIEIFIPDFCRTLRFDFEDEVEVNGIKGYKYVIGVTNFDNGTLIPENKCNCDGDCIPSGVINITKCFWDLPVFISLPHFNGADPVYLDAIEGFDSERIDKPYIILEPTTNLPLEADVTLQVNLYIQPVEGISMLEGIPKIMFPLLWFERDGKLPATLVSILKVFLMLPNIIVGTSVVLILLGISLLMLVNRKPALLFLCQALDKQTVLMLPKPEKLALNQSETEKMLKC